MNSLSIVSGTIAAVAVLPGLFLLALLRKLRRSGRPDTAGERVLYFYLVYCTVRAVTAFTWPHAPLWAVLGPLGPLFAVCFGFLYVRVRRHPEAVLSPATVRRWRSCRGHR